MKRKKERNQKKNQEKSNRALLLSQYSLFHIHKKGRKNKHIVVRPISTEKTQKEKFKLEFPFPLTSSTTEKEIVSS
jgi:hypothetical protein